MVKRTIWAVVAVFIAWSILDFILHAAVFGLFTPVNMRGTGAVAKGELMRFFAEAA